MGRQDAQHSWVASHAGFICAPSRTLKLFSHSRKGCTEVLRAECITRGRGTLPQPKFRLAFYDRYWQCIAAGRKIYGGEKRGRCFLDRGKSPAKPGDCVVSAR